MAHTHNNCPQIYYTCADGRRTSRCEDDNCYDEYCMDLGHCTCKCHSGKTCNCGYQWERMEKMADDKKAEEQKRKDDADDSNYAAGGAVR